MTFNRIFREAIVGGISGLIVVLIYIALHAKFGDIDLNEWLGFFGAIIGSGTAVLGAIYIEHYKREMAHKEGTVAIRDAMREIARCLQYCISPLDKTENGIPVSQIIELRENLAAAQEFSGYVMGKYTINDTLTWRRTQEISRQIDMIREVTYYYYDDHAREDLCSVETVNSWHNIVSRKSRILLPLVEITLNDLSARTGTPMPAVNKAID